MASPIINPVVACIHFDDVDNVFKLSLTREVDEPNGKHVEDPKIFEQLVDLAQVFVVIAQLWGAIGPAGRGTLRAGIRGDLGATAALFAAHYIPEPP